MRRHEQKITRFDEAQRRRQAEAEAATERARAHEAAQALAKLRTRDPHRRPPSVPPPGR